MIQFTVYGLAQPAGSKRAFPFKRRNGTTGVAVSDANPKSKEWKTLVAFAAQQHRPPQPLTGAVAVTFTFIRPRPASHFNSKGALNASGHRAPWPTTKPDALKLARGVEDALTGIIWQDDSQIVDERLIKRWGESACVVVTIHELIA